MVRCTNRSIVAENFLGSKSPCETHHRSLRIASRTLLGLLLLAALAACAASATPPDSAPADAWPVARGTPSGCGISGSALAEKPQLAWTFDAGHRGFQAGAAIVDGTVFVGSTNGTLYAIDLANGQKRQVYDSKSKFDTAPAVR